MERYKQSGREVKTRKKERYKMRYIGRDTHTDKQKCSGREKETQEEKERGIEKEE
jgi:hypothetical protein